MKKVRSIAIACCLTALAFLLAGCVTINVQGKSSEASEDAGASSESAASAAASTPASSTAASSSAESASASGASASAASSAAAQTGTAKYDLGDLYMLNVHNGSSGPVADAIVEVVNTGDTGLVLGNSSITIFDANGSEIVKASGNGVFTGPSYLRPGDIGFIYTAGAISMPNGYSSADDYKITAEADVKAVKEVWEYPISNKSLSDNGVGAPLVTGTVTNDDSEKANLVEITAIFLDNEGTILGVASDVVVNLEPGASTQFSIDGTGLPVGCTMAMISEWDVIAVAPKY